MEERICAKMAFLVHLFGGRDPGELGVAELKRRAAKRDGRKPYLVKREVRRCEGCWCYGCHCKEMFRVPILLCEHKHGSSPAASVQAFIILF